MTAPTWAETVSVEDLRAGTKNGSRDCASAMWVSPVAMPSSLPWAKAVLSALLTKRSAVIVRHLGLPPLRLCHRHQHLGHLPARVVQASIIPDHVIGDTNLFV